MADLSVRNQSEGAQRIADAMLRATGGYTALLQLPSAVGDRTDAGQLGLNAPGFQSLTLSPVTFRQMRRLMQEGEPARYELLVSAAAVAEQVSLLALGTADALFEQVAGVTVAGLPLLLEEWSSTASVGQALMYQLLLRAAMPQTLTPQT